MEISPENRKVDVNRTEFLLAEGRHVKPDIIQKLIGFFTMNSQDRLKAGIFVGREGREWIEHSSLHIPFLDQDNPSSEQR